MFTVQQRERLRATLVSAARADPWVAGAALTGSAALGREDRWSDIDLALRLAAGADEAVVLADWTTRMYDDHGAVHHLDVWRGQTRFRVLLLASSLQVDIAFWAWDAFGATGPAFALLFGAANPLPVAPPRPAAELIGMAWLHALHARSSIARGRVWQAEYMVSGLRDHVFALACLRVGVPAIQGRGMDDLPAEITLSLAPAIVRSLETSELRRAFAAAADAFLHEVGYIDADLTSRLAKVVRLLVSGDVATEL